MTALVGSEVKRSLSAGPEPGRIAGEFGGSAAFESHHAARQ